MRKIRKLLVANRGEIALRVMRTAKNMGIQTIAVHSVADADAPFAQFADVAIDIAGPLVADSYLRIDKILAAARESGADAIHPGYGLLSENSDFARACEKEGVIFIGPPQRAIEVMGDKARSKRAMLEAGVPCIPGYQGEDQSDERLLAEARNMDLPLMVKAAAGGGGRGMRLVHEASELESALKAARSEAKNAFGSDQLILEKAVLRPRHVEIQIFGDQHGNIIHLGERDCSVQRRHQKVVEESPCLVMTEKLRTEMGAAAVEAARAVEYFGAGTVEFLLDEKGKFYFLEMNTRLQVEHPVTELVTGQDLVAWQLRVAAGEALPLTQDEVELSGHAIEIRLCAEDPAQDYLPATGPVELFVPPPEDLARTDSGIQTGGEVSPYYDSMLAKIISHGKTRAETLDKLIRALEQTALIGVQNNRDFLIQILSNEKFAQGKATTAFLQERYGETGFQPETLTLTELALAALVQHYAAHRQALANALPISPELINWSSTGGLASPYIYDVEGAEKQVTIYGIEPEKFKIEVDGSELTAEVIHFSESKAAFRFDGTKIGCFYHLDVGQKIDLVTETKSFNLTNLALGREAGSDAAGGGQVVAPMHGQLLELLVKKGQRVARGAKLAVLEAMKMQHEITAEIDGTIENIHAQVGEQLAADALILEIEPETTDS